MSNYAFWNHIGANRMITLKPISKQLNKFHKNSSSNRTYSMSSISNFIAFGQVEVGELNQEVMVCKYNSK
jgi:hypothetical protein